MNKAEEIYATCNIYKVKLAIITETWLSSDSNIDVLQWSNYSFFYKNRTVRKGGGVALWCHNDLFPRQLRPAKDFQIDDVDILSVNITVNKIDVLIFAVYVPPSLNDNSDIDVSLTEFFDDMVKENNSHHLLICGDFNRIEHSLMEGELNIHNIVCNTTRGNAVLDKIFVDAFVEEHYSEPLILPPIGTSDHNTVISKSKCNCNSKQEFPRFTVVYDFRASSISHAYTFLNSINWPSNLNSLNIDTMWDNIYSAFNFALSLVPSKQIKRTKNDKPWITNKIKLLINDRYRAFYSKDTIKFLALRDKVRKEIFKAKCTWLRDSKYKKSLWSAVKNAESKNNLTFSSAYIPEITHTLKQLYENEDLPLRNPNHSQHDDFIPTNRLDIEMFIANELSKLKINKCSGPDKISNNFLRSFNAVISQPLSILINSILTTNMFPDVLKQAVIVPVPKNKKADGKNFRPISLINTTSRIIERFILNIFEKDFDNAYGYNQFGFRKHSSTTMAIIYALQTISKILNNTISNGCIIIALDFSKAFDTVNHVHLIAKISNTVSIKASHLIHNYLYQRTAAVMIDNKHGEKINLLKGVPQGSCLGPALFNVYISDLTPYYENTTIIKYADDITLILPITTDINTRTTDEINHVKKWCLQNKMKLNEAKTQILPILKRKKSLDNFSFKTCDSLRFLGIIIDKKLSFTEHFSQQCIKASRNIYLLKALTKICNPRELNTIFISKITSIIEYCLPAISNISYASLIKIQRIYKRCAHITQSEERDVTASQCQQIMKLFISLQHKDVFHEFLPQKLTSGRYFIPVICNNLHRHSFFIRAAFLFNESFTR